MRYTLPILRGRAQGPINGTVPLEARVEAACNWPTWQICRSEKMSSVQPLNDLIDDQDLPDRGSGNGIGMD